MESFQVKPEGFTNPIWMFGQISIDQLNRSYCNFGSDCESMVHVAGRAGSPRDLHSVGSPSGTSTLFGQDLDPTFFDVPDGFSDCVHLVGV